MQAKNYPIYQFKKQSLMAGVALFLALFFCGPVLAQTPMYFKSGTGTSGNTIPLNTAGQRTQLLYTPSDFNITPMSGLITKIYLRNSAAGATATYTDFKVSFLQNNDQSFTSTSYLTGLTQVINAASFSITANATAGGWFEIPIPAPFIPYNNAQSLIIEISYTARTGGISTITSVTSGITKRNSGTDPVATTGFLGTNWNDFGMDVIAAGPCTAPPVAGQATSTVSSVCPNTNFQLSLTGAGSGSGLTYQWQSSPNGTTGWTNITGATNSTLTTTQTTTNFYRAQLTCSGQTTSSTPVQVTTTGTPVTGTFTIDKNSPASATNFVSFAAAIASIECGGAGGPIVFNVVSGSGPYNEQVTIPVIPGTSATNTVTFNGNNNRISFANTTSDRAVLRLDGADFITFSNFLIDATDAAFGWGIHLQNGADNNTLTGNTITISSTNTVESNSVGIVLANSTTLVTAAGNTGSNNTISGNTIIGGYKGIHVNGIVTTASNNQIINNTIQDFYADGIQVNAANGTLVDGNNISRPTRTTTTTFAGIEVSGNSLNTIISRNRIHNSHAATTSKTGTAYGIYFTASDAPVGNENIARNNLIYNINNTGTIYGIYNSSSDGAHYFHNTISLNNTANTGIIRGFYQLTAATNIRFINNIVSIAAGATGAKHALYFGTTTSAITSNNNVLHLTGGASTSGIGFYSSNQVTLANWQAVNSGAYDQNSIAIDPQFANAATGDFTPTNVAVNNTGQGGTGVTTDILGTTRNPNAPDPGAYEFMNNAIDVGIAAITSPNSVCGLSAAENIVVTLTNFGTNPQSNIPLSYTINAGTPVTATFAGPLAPGASVTYTFTTPANLSAAGGYTIVAQTALPGDLEPSNNSTTKVVTNALFPSLPIVVDFETPATGLGAMKLVTNSRSTVVESAGASSTIGVPSTKGLIMAGINSAAWVLPGTQVNPWTNNLEHLSGVYLCFAPNAASADSLILTLDLRQLSYTINSSTNFRVTVNGTQVGPTYRPNFDPAIPNVWQTIRVNLNAYKAAATIEIGLESSVREEYNNGNGTANLVDNIRIIRYVSTGLKDNQLQSQLLVYPNPANGLFNVQLPQGKTYELTVTDLAGKIISRQTATAGTHQLQLNQPAKGIYLLQVKGESGTATRKLIVE